MSITTWLGRLHGHSIYYGPFPSRTVAEKFANDSLVSSNASLRRGLETRSVISRLHLFRDENVPGSLFRCTDQEYALEVGRAQVFFDTAGDSLVRRFLQRDQASTDLRFEDAATLHAKLEKLKPVLLNSRSGSLHRPAGCNHGAAQCATWLCCVFRVARGASQARFSSDPIQRAYEVAVDGVAVSSRCRLLSTEGKAALETMEHLHCSNAGTIAAHA
jgi:hypothetical protein